MTTKRIPLADASAEQLRTFAETHLGMTLPAGEKLAKLRAQVAQAWAKDEIVVPDQTEAAPSQEGQPPPPATAAQRARAVEVEKVRLIINRTDEAGGDEPVPVGVNGKVMLIPRGEEVAIPVTYFEVLKNAVRHIYDPLPNGGINPVPRQVPAYPYQRIA